MNNYHKYLFILFQPSSGSTVINKTFNNCANVAGLNGELRNYIKSWQEKNEYVFSHSEELDEYIRVMTLKRNDYLQPKWNWKRYRDLYLWYLEKRNNKEIWDYDVLVEKSPTNMLVKYPLESVFDNNYFIVLMRNPYALAESLLRRTDFDLESIATHLIDVFRQQQRNLKDPPRQKNHLIRYEDFTEHPDEVKTDLEEFLDVELEEWEPKRVFHCHNISDSAHQELQNFNEQQINNLDDSQKSYLKKRFQEAEKSINSFGYEL